MLTKSLLAATLLACSSLVNAAWIKAGVNDNVSVYFDDSGRSVNAAGNKVYRTLYEFRKATTKAPGVGDVKSLITALEVDCTAGQVKMEDFVAYSKGMGTGKSFVHSGEGEWQKVNGTHVWHDFVEVVCPKR